jgi:hypothetical protein
MVAAVAALHAAAGGIHASQAAGMRRHSPARSKLGASAAQAQYGKVSARVFDSMDDGGYLRERRRPSRTLCAKFPKNPREGGPSPAGGRDMSPYSR